MGKSSRRPRWRRPGVAGVNLHASLLPKYRGAAPINWAIYHGETETGVTVIHMTPQIDAGPCIAQARAAIGPDETAVELEVRLAEAWGQAGLRDDRADGLGPRRRRCRKTPPWPARPRG